MKVFIVGVSGVSGGGKTTLTTKLYDYLSDRANAHAFDNYRIDQVLLIQQDKYFYPRDSAHHIWIKDINFINRELMSAVDGEQMWHDIETTVSQLKTTAIDVDANCNLNGMCILLIEGFLIFNDDRISDLCNVRFHLTLTPEVCLKRRLQRTWKHVNPQPIKYFHEYVWPSYEKHRDSVKNANKIYYLNGEQPKERLFEDVLQIIAQNITI